MTLIATDRYMPWTGAVAGLGWVGAALLRRTASEDVPGGATAQVINANLARNYGSQACLVLMGVSLLFFATSLRSLLRSGEAEEATYSNVVSAGLLVAVSGVTQMVVWGWAEFNGAADAHDRVAVRILDYGGYFAWAAMGIGLAAALIGTGLGGLRSSMLPRWFAVTSLVLGGLAALGNAGIPPGGLVTYLLLPLWLVIASAVVAHRQQANPRHSLLAAAEGV